MNVTDYISSHPSIALVVGLTHLTIAEKVIPNYEVPVIVMQSFQILAWTVTISVGLITIIPFVRKHLRFKK